MTSINNLLKNKTQKSLVRAKEQRVLYETVPIPNPGIIMTSYR